MSGGGGGEGASLHHEMGRKLLQNRCIWTRVPGVMVPEAQVQRPWPVPRVQSRLPLKPPPLQMALPCQ